MALQNHPISYRVSQGAMSVAFAMIISPLGLVAEIGPNAKILLTATIWFYVCLSLCVSFYVIARYPFLSLLEPTEGDHFKTYFGSSANRLYSVLKIAAIMVVLLVIYSLLLDGKNDLLRFLKLSYMIVMLFFLLFMAMAYKPKSHPTVATYIRATLGFGVLLFPIFIPALVVGSIRCRRLLEDPSHNIRTLM